MRDHFCRLGKDSYQLNKTETAHSALEWVCVLGCQNFIIQCEKNVISFACQFVELVMIKVGLWMSK